MRSETQGDLILIANMKGLCPFDPAFAATWLGRQTGVCLYAA